MKTIKVPDPIDLPGQPERGTLAAFVAFLLAVDQRFNMSGAGIRAAVKIDLALSQENPALEDADWELLAAACENPQPAPGLAAYPWRPAAVCAPFVEAIRSAG
jgi:hypothetical protein